MTSRTFRALLIGNWNYNDPDGVLQQLKGARNDPTRLHEALTHGEFGLFDEVLLRENLTGQQLNEEMFNFVDAASPEDILLIYFSGHGERLARQQLGLCGVDLKYSGREPGCFRSTTLSDWLVYRNRAKSTIVVLDCCYSGGFKGTLQDEELASFGTGTVVLSSGGDEPTKDASSEEDPSPFTAALIDVLTNASLAGDAGGLVSTLAVYEALLQYQPALKPPPKIRGEVKGRLAIAKRPQSPDAALTPLKGWVQPQEIDVIDVVFDGQTVTVRIGDDEERRDLAAFDPLRRAAVRRLGHLADAVARLPRFANDERLQIAMRRTWSCVGANLFETAMPRLLRDRITGDLDLTGRHVLKIRLRFGEGAGDVETYPWEYLGRSAGRGDDRPLALQRGLLVERVPTKGSKRFARSQAGAGKPSVAVINSFTDDLENVGRRVAGDLAALPRMNLVVERHGRDASWGAFIDTLDQRPHYLVLCMPLRRFGRGVGQLGFAKQQGGDPDFRSTADVLKAVRAVQLTFDGVVIVSFAASPSEDAFRGTYEVSAAVAEDGHRPVVFVCHTRGYETYLHEATNTSFPGLLLDAVSRDKWEFDRCFWYARSRVVTLAEPKQLDAFGIPGFYGVPSHAPATSQSGAAPSPTGAGSPGSASPGARPLPRTAQERS